MVIIKGHNWKKVIVSHKGFMEIGFCSFLYLYIDIKGGARCMR